MISQSTVPALKASFMAGALDPEIHHVLQTSVPPINLDAVAFLRPFD